MARLDPTYGELRRSLEDSSLNKEQLSDIKNKMAAREERLLPVYLQIALQFADLHDRAGRMEAKNVIRTPLHWKDARRFFYWRLRRRLSEELILKRLLAVAPNPRITTPTKSTQESPRTIHLRTLHAWTGLLDDELERDDHKVATWYEENTKLIQTKIDSLKTQNVSAEVAQLLVGNKEGALKGVHQVLSSLPVAEKESVFKYLASA